MQSDVVRSSPPHPLGSDPSFMHQAVVESNLNDIRFFIEEMESFDIYALKPETLKSWGLRLRNIVDILERHAHHAPNATLQQNAVSPVHPPSRGRDGGGLGTAAGSNRKVSIARSRLDATSFGGTVLPSSVGTGALSDGAVGGTAGAPCSVAAHVASTIHMLLDLACQLTHAEWSTAFVYREASKKLVSIGGAGRRQGRPGDVKLHANVGVEHLVLENGVAVCMGLASSEKDFSEEQDKHFSDHTKTMLVFPLLKPGSTSTTIGLLEVGNRALNGPFTEAEEAIVVDIAFLMAALITRYPNDVTSPHALEPSIFLKSKDVDKSATMSASREPQRVYRTGLHGPPRKADMLRDAAALPRTPTIESALDHMAYVNDSWKSAVLLNVELEHEIRRLHEALRISRRETSRLQEILATK